MFETAETGFFFVSVSEGGREVGREMNDSVKACGMTKYELIKTSQKIQSIHVNNNIEIVSFDLEIGRQNRRKRRDTENERIMSKDIER